MEIALEAKGININMKIQVKSYLEKKFPDLYSEIHVRFELGDPYPNGSDLRINQVYKRVKKIFYSIFDYSDEIYVLVKDWDSPDQMFGNTTPRYLYSLLPSGSLETETVVEEEEDVDGSKIFHSHKEHFLETKLVEVKVDLILEGIANYEQGREPSIGQSVYFINIQKDILFYMYDDRGCIVYSDIPDKIIGLYNCFNEWIVK